jgi:hypothetical protein
MYAVMKGFVLVALTAAKARLPAPPAPPALIALPCRFRPSTQALLLLAAACWGVLVDSSAIPVLAPTSNSTLFQASTAALFALLGIFGGPLAGALGDSCATAAATCSHSRCIPLWWPSRGSSRGWAAPWWMWSRM